MLGEYEVQEITTEVLQDFVLYLEEENGLNPTTVKNIFGRLATVLNKAHKEGIIIEIRVPMWCSQRQAQGQARH